MSKFGVSLKLTLYMANFWFKLSKFVRRADKSRLRGNGLAARICGKSDVDRNGDGFASAYLLAWCGLLAGRKKKCVQDGKVTESEIIHDITLAKIALNDSNFKHAEKILRRTLLGARDINFVSGTVYAYDMLAAVAMNSGNAQETESYLLAVIDYLQSQGVPEDDNLVVNFKLKLSKLYFNKGDDVSADIGFKHCLMVQKQNVTYRGDEETKVLLALILYWYGKFLVDRERFEEAKAFLEDCYLMCSKLRNVHPSQLLLILYNLGEVCHILGEYEKALGHFTSAVALDREIKSPGIMVGVFSIAKKICEELKRRCCQSPLRTLSKPQQNTTDYERQSNDYPQILKLVDFY